MATEAHEDDDRTGAETRNDRAAGLGENAEAIAVRMLAVEPIYGLTREQYRAFDHARDAGRAWGAKSARASELIGLEREILGNNHEPDANRLTQYVCDYLRTHWEWSGTWEKLLYALLLALDGTKASDRDAAERLVERWGLADVLRGWQGDGPFMEVEFGAAYPYELAGFLEGALHLWLDVKDQVLKSTPEFNWP